MSRTLPLIALLAAPIIVTAQNPPARTSQTAATSSAGSSELEPVALHALQRMSEQLQRATTFSFKARIMREEPGTNGQMLDFFHYVTAQVGRPGKMRLAVVSDTSDLTLWYDGKNVTVMPVSARMFSTLASAPTLDGTLEMLRDKMNVHTPLFPFLSSNAYQRLSQGLQSANEIGFINVGNEQLLHLAFTEADADWQLWLTGPHEVVPRRIAIIYKNVEGQPRVTIDFSDWNLNAEIPASAFMFEKPEGAVQADWNALKPRPVEPGSKTGGDR
ncbi:MAG TPA: DUF2092 domain-containing protein [Bryobacteraceae bacterium]|nr:DUF2092 domain-containing protein [Bryobacteraceae bacterium]